MKKIAATLIAALTLSGCHAGGFVDSIAPQTAAGFRASGIVGGANALSGVLIAECRKVDGETVKVAVDGFAKLLDGETLVEAVRRERQALCAKIEAGAVLKDALTGG